MEGKNTRKVSVILVAAGEGKRFGSAKVFAHLRGKPLLEHCLEVFDSHPDVFEIVCVVKNPREQKKWLSLFAKVSQLAQGGLRRRDSVLAGFEKIDPAMAPIVLVHDGARPLVSRDLIDRVIDCTGKTGAAVPVIPVSDTIKKVERGKVSHTLERQGLFRTQTPQGFSYNVLKLALARAENEDVTDEAVLVEKMGFSVCAVEGDPKNIKVTVPSDLTVAEALIDD